MSEAHDRFRAQIRKGYFLEGDDGQPWPEKEWCQPCAIAVTFYYRRRRGIRGLSWWECWSGDDGPRRCRSCGAVLNTGGLTRHGVDEEIEHFERYGPKGAGPDLIMVLDALDKDDPRRPQALAWLEEAASEPEPIPLTMRDLLP